MKMKVKENKRLIVLLKEANGKRRERTLHMGEICNIVEKADIYMEGVALKYREGTTIRNSVDLPKAYKYKAVFTSITLIFDGKYWNVQDCATESTETSSYDDSRWILQLSEEAHKRLFPRGIEI